MISIIMPAYNSEKYIDQSIESVLGQSYDELELLIINDGSTDHTKELILKQQQNDQRIKYFEIENAGSAVARNVGLENASGDYIAFVDSDDWIDQKMMEVLMEKAKEYNADIVGCSYHKIINGERIAASTHLPAGFYNEQGLEKEVYPKLLIDESFQSFIPRTMVTKIFKRSLIEKNSIRFVDKLKRGQDTMFTVENLLQARSFYYLPDQKLYYYVNNQSSRTHSYLENGWEIMKEQYLQYERIAEEFPEYELKDRLAFELIAIAKSALVNLMFNRESSRKEKIKEIRKIVNDADLEERIAGMAIEKNNLKNRLFIKSLQKKRVYLLYFISNLYYKKNY